MEATLSLTHCGSLDPDHILYNLLSGSSDTRQVRLRSRCPFVSAAQNLLDNLARLGFSASEWTNHKWNVEYYKGASRFCAFVPGTGARPVGMGFPQAAWVKLNCLWIGVGQFCLSMHKWGLPHQIVSVASLSKPQSMPYTSSITWSTRSDGFG